MDRDPTEIGDCEECGETEYLYPLHGRRLCTTCQVKLTVPLIQPDPPTRPFPLPPEPEPDDDEENDDMTITNGNGKFTALWAAIAVVVLAFTVGFMSQSSEIAVAKADKANIEKRLESIESKVNTLLERSGAQAARNAERDARDRTN